MASKDLDPDAAAKVPLNVLLGSFGTRQYVCILKVRREPNGPAPEGLAWRMRWIIDPFRKRGGRRELAVAVGLVSCVFVAVKRVVNNVADPRGYIQQQCTE